MSSVLSNTLLGFGLFAIFVAIVGGGAKALGFEVGVLQSLKRQRLVAVFGAALVVAAEWGSIKSVLPRKQITESVGPAVLDTGKTLIIPLSLNHAGPVDVELQSLEQEWAESQVPKGGLGQDGLSITICPAAETVSCPPHQLGVSQVFRQQLPAGPATISVFNFASSPRMKFELRIRHPA